MGRLTLNVLLSFAQFEREVTAERIRDKVAASKKRGIWMGGNPPLGYDIASRKLVVNADEAETVRLIFQRYLDLGCVRLLANDLAQKGIVSKQRVIGGDRKIGGRPIGRSALFLLLNNRVYLGETTHKGASYKGEHEAILPRKLFESVQLKLAENRQPVANRPRVRQEMALSGLVFDETGSPMLATYTLKKGSMRYCYDVSRPRLKGDTSRAAITRIPAPKFEGFISSVLARFRLAAVDPHSIVRRIDIMARSIRIQLNKAAAMTVWRAQGQGHRDKALLDHAHKRLLPGELLSGPFDQLMLVLPVSAKFRGGRAVDPQTPDKCHSAPSPNLPLIKAVARAHRWHEMLLSGEASSVGMISRRFGFERGHVGLTLNLAFLSPKITRAILDGEQPRGLRLTHLLGANIPPVWREQDDLVARLAEAGRRSLVQPYPICDQQGRGEQKQEPNRS